jgi:hypothetical protein
MSSLGSGREVCESLGELRRRAQVEQGIRMDAGHYHELQKRIGQTDQTFQEEKKQPPTEGPWKIFSL